MLFFFFKQKTAYEMRISDWSSDVCSSDLAGIKRFSVRQRELAERIREARATVEQNAGAAAANDDLTEQLNWSIRIFDERETSMTYLCEQPVLLEQRARHRGARAAPRAGQVAGQVAVGNLQRPPL